MTWWDAVRAWFDGKRQTAFPKPADAAPEQKTVYTGRADWISKRVNLPTSMSSGELAAEWDAKIRAQAFFSARVAQGHVLDKLREVSDAFSRGEIGQAEARTMLKRFLRAEGLDDGSAGLKNLASTARLNLILEQNARMAAAVGQYQEGMDPDVKDFFPCWRYIGSTAMNPRDSHAKYAGHVYRKDDPIWHKIFPPSDFGCKCSVENCDEPPEKSPARVELPDSGFHFDPAHAFEDFDLSSINDAKLREETRQGLNQIMAEKHAVFNNIDFRNDNKPRQELQAGLDAVGNVWSRPELKNIPVDFMKDSNPNLAGVTHVDGAGQVTAVKVFSNSPHPALTFVHETGHVIDKVLLTSPKMKKAKQELLNLLKSTDEYKRLVEQREQLLKKPKLTRKQKNALIIFDYKISDEELLARAYTQVVSKNKSGKLLEEFRNSVKLAHSDYFESVDVEIQEKFEAILKGVGLL